MNTTSAKVILDSVAENGERLITVECIFWRAILAEVNTHRDFSRNSASSRAIPFSKQVSKVIDDPFIPIEFGVNRPGMQASEVLSGADLDEAVKVWLDARDAAVFHARRLADLHVHKQIVNRLLEPFMWHVAVISSTKWENFFSQRESKHGMAQPEMMALADSIRKAIDGSTPRLLKVGQWHTPYIMPQEEQVMCVADKMRLSVARCAGTSYLNQDTMRPTELDLSLFQRLISGRHQSPNEHVATPLKKATSCANYKGWKQLRWYAERGGVGKILERESYA